MKLVYYTPAYRQLISVRTRINYARIVRDLALENPEHSVVDLWSDFCSIPRARNWALRTALESGADYILMQDADVFADRSVNLFTELRNGLADATAIAAATPLRRTIQFDGPMMLNVQPVKPGVYDCDTIGSGVLLIDLKRLKTLTGHRGPWFANLYSDDGCVVTMSEDIYFCHAVRNAGGKVRAHAGLPMSHVIYDSVDYVPGRNVLTGDALPASSVPNQ